MAGFRSQEAMFKDIQCLWLERGEPLPPIKASDCLENAMPMCNLPALIPSRRRMCVPHAPTCIQLWII